MTVKQFGRYETIGELGRGAMGVVFRARDPQLDRVVALKTLTVPPGTSAERAAELHQRFAREARTAGRLIHPNIVQIYDSGEDYIAMELVEGLTLDALAERSPFTLPQALDILEQIAHALDYAHDQGVIHRDVKPSNILVSHLGVAKVMDFGIAKVLGSTAATSSLMGTPRYMSPEQVSEAPITQASDNFAFAEIAYELLTHQQAFPGDTVANILYRIVHEDPPPASRVNPDLPRHLDAVFAKALAKQPAHRYDRALHFVHDLRVELSRFDLGGLETQAVSPPPLESKGWGSVARIVLIPPLVVAAAVLTLLLLLPEARDVARDVARGLTGSDSGPGALPPAGSRVDPPPEAPSPEPTATDPAAADPAPDPEPSTPPKEDPAADDPAPRATPAVPAPPMPPPKAATPTPDVAAEPVAPSPLPQPSLASDGLYGIRFFERPFPGIAGAQVRSVDATSPAWSAGLRPKDIITGWRGKSVAGFEDLQSEVRVRTSRVEVEFLHEDGGMYQRRSATIVTDDAAVRPSVAINAVELEHDARQDDERGIMIHSGLEARGYGTRRLSLRLQMEEILGDGSTAPLSLPDSSSRRGVRPDSDLWSRSRISLFVPYEKLPQSGGEHAMRVKLAVEDESGRVLATYSPLPFLLTRSPH